MLRVVIGRAKTAGVEELDWERFDVEELSTLAETPTLLGETRRYLLRGALAGERGDAFLALANILADSSHEFILEEEKLLKAPMVKLEKAGAKVEVQKEKKPIASSRQGFDPFGLTAALAARDRKRLWLGLTAALGAGEKPEALAGLLAWKARQMKNAKLSSELTSLYHDSHRGAGDLELLLERFALLL